MSGERLLASYIMRILVRAGKRSITLHNIKTGEIQSFGSYREVLEHLGHMEEVFTHYEKPSKDNQINPHG